MWGKPLNSSSSTVTCFKYIFLALKLKWTVVAKKLCRLCKPGLSASLTATGMSSWDFPMCRHNSKAFVPLVFKLNWGASQMSFCAGINALMTECNRNIILFFSVYSLSHSNPAYGSKALLIRSSVWAWKGDLVVRTNILYGFLHLKNEEH